METVYLSQPKTRRRSILVTLIAWGMMLIGLVGMPISVITALMFLAKSYGTANAGFWDSCVVVLGPALVMVTGWGLFNPDHAIGASGRAGTLVRRGD